MKREAYPEPKRPRVITTIPPGEKYELSRYALVVGALLKTLSIYAFGKTCREIATRVGEICTGADCVASTDLSDCDGTFREFTILGFKAWICSLFTDTEASYFRIQFDNVWNGAAVATGGIYYKPGFANRSGNPFTSILTFYVNAFIQYAGFRSLGYNQSDAMNALGIYGGDDGLTRIPPRYLAELSAFETVAANIGMFLKMVPVPRGESPPFLGRIYSPAIFASPPDVCSIQDPARTLSKIHCSSSPDAETDPLAVMAAKAYGLLVLDPKTPVISDIAHAYLRISGRRPPVSVAQAIHEITQAKQLEHVSYMVRYGDYPNSCSDWTWTAVSTSLGITVDELLVHIQQIKLWTKIEDVQKLCELEPPKAGILAVVDGEVRSGDEPYTAKAPKDTKTRQKANTNTTQRGPGPRGGSKSTVARSQRRQKTKVAH